MARTTPMAPHRDPDSIRPGVAVAAIACLALLLLAAGAVVGSAGPGEVSIDDEREAGGRRVVLLRDDEDHDVEGRVRDPGARGSVREQWERASREAPPPVELPPMVEALVDPQISAFRAQWSDGTPPPFEPIEQRARVLSATGGGIDADAPCEVRVLPMRHSGFGCLARVICGGTVVYPNPSQTAGYLDCSVDAAGRVSGVDEGPTTVDGDPAIRFDPATGRVRISNLDWNGPGTAFDVEVALEPGSMRSGV